MRLRFAALLILLIAVAVSLIGCAKVIDTQTETVEATIVETRLTPGYYTTMIVGKTQILQWHPPIYRTTLKYNDITENIYESELYSIAHGFNGDTIQCSLITETYDDGTVNQYLEWRK